MSHDLSYRLKNSAEGPKRANLQVFIELISLNSKFYRILFVGELSKKFVHKTNEKSSTANSQKLLKVMMNKLSITFGLVTSLLFSYSSAFCLVCGEKDKQYRWYKDVESLKNDFAVKVDVEYCIGMAICGKRDEQLKWYKNFLELVKDSATSVDSSACEALDTSEDAKSARRVQKKFRAQLAYRKSISEKTLNAAEDYLKSCNQSDSQINTKSIEDLAKLAEEAFKTGKYLATSYLSGEQSKKLPSYEYMSGHSTYFLNNDQRLSKDIILRTDEAMSRNKDYVILYKAVPASKLSLIMKQGLHASYGGLGGSSDAIGNKNIRIERDRGRQFFTPFLSTAQLYAEEILGPKSKPVILEVRIPHSKTLEYGLTRQFMGGLTYEEELFITGVNPIPPESIRYLDVPSLSEYAKKKAEISLGIYPSYFKEALEDKDNKKHYRENYNSALNEGVKTGSDSIFKSDSLVARSFYQKKGRGQLENAIIQFKENKITGEQLKGILMKNKKYLHISDEDGETIVSSLVVSPGFFDVFKIFMEVDKSLLMSKVGSERYSLAQVAVAYSKAEEIEYLKKEAPREIWVDPSVDGSTSIDWMATRGKLDIFLETIKENDSLREFLKECRHYIKESPACKHFKCGPDHCRARYNKPSFSDSED